VIQNLRSFIMRELNMQEIESVNGGFVFVVPPAVKFIAWVAAAAGAGVGAYYADQLFS
jgi:hypothetical protein